MFKKKVIVDEWSYEDRKVKELNESMSCLLKDMTQLCREVMIHEGSANMLPDGADRDLELELVRKYREQIRNCLSAYDDDKRAFRAIDKTKLKHCSNGVAEMCPTHAALNIAWRDARRSL